MEKQKFQLLIDGWCYVCGENNPEGFHLNYEKIDESTVKYKVQFQKKHSGYQNIVHGGFISMVLDEAMARIAILKNYKVVTSRLNVKFLRPVAIHTEYEVWGKFIKKEGKFLFAHAKITKDNKTYAAANAWLYAFDD